MKFIHIPNSDKQIIVDDIDYPVISKLYWYCTPKRVYTNIPYTISIGRLILGLKKGDKRQCDHINCDPFDNRRENIRICTLAQNNRNRKKYKGNYLSEYKGVSFYKRRKTKPWFAQIMVNGKNIYLGIFASEVEAACAYDKAARLHFGEFAQVNFHNY